MADVFDTTPENVPTHLRNVYSIGELEAGATTKDCLVVQSEGKRSVRRRPCSASRSTGPGRRKRPTCSTSSSRTTRSPTATKRIGSLLFLLYLKQEGVEHRLNPQALTALTLLIAESAPVGKDLMIRLIANLLAEGAG